MKAIIPAAGYATRLYPLTENHPKALLEVGGKAMIEYCIDKITDLGVVEEIFIVTNNKFVNHFEKRSKSYSSNLSIKIINDGTLSNEDRLGALGDLQFVIDKENINDDILIMAGDNLFEDDLLPLYKNFTTSQCSSISVYDLGNIGQASAFGVVEVNAENKIVSFEEKPKNPKSSLISTMVYFIKKGDLGAIQKCIDNGKGDNGGELIRELAKSSSVLALPLNGYRYDIGNKDQLESVRKKLG